MAKLLEKLQLENENLKSKRPTTALAQVDHKDSPPPPAREPIPWKGTLEQDLDHVPDPRSKFFADPGEGPPFNRHFYKVKPKAYVKSFFSGSHRKESTSCCKEAR